MLFSFTDLFLDDILCDYLLASLLPASASSRAPIQFGHRLVNKENKKIKQIELA